MDIDRLQADHLTLVPHHLLIVLFASFLSHHATVILLIPLSVGDRLRPHVALAVGIYGPFLLKSQRSVLEGHLARVHLSGIDHLLHEPLLVAQQSGYLLHLFGGGATLPRLRDGLRVVPRCLLAEVLAHLAWCVLHTGVGRSSRHAFGGRIHLGVGAGRLADGLVVEIPLNVLLRASLFPRHSCVCTLVVLVRLHHKRLCMPSIHSRKVGCVRVQSLVLTLLEVRGYKLRGLLEIVAGLSMSKVVELRLYLPVTLELLIQRLDSPVASLDLVDRRLHPRDLFAAPPTGVLVQVKAALLIVDVHTLNCFSGILVEVLRGKVMASFRSQHLDFVKQIVQVRLTLAPPLLLPISAFETLILNLKHGIDPLKLVEPEISLNGLFSFLYVSIS